MTALFAFLSQLATWLIGALLERADRPSTGREAKSDPAEAEKWFAEYERLKAKQ